ncbi:MAG: tRNA pseudouridine(38-40) synthase TruA [Candidatus Borkfalkiaceae bacterium]|nr:tRNA pseudouridine(38-40) synthase TruA [Clostridia bacterium]MDY6224074.1 tRNA pseudouridine(38-40) synthase TruA [Christensenellaceae bacterium]
MRYVAAISYDGTEYAGWQRQKNAVSVQETLENALLSAFGEKITVTASGRTDAGVHAEEQIVHFDAELSLPPEKLPEAVNKFLPGGVSILKSARAKEGFDANRSAKKKTYRYSLYTYPQKLPLKERFAVRQDAVPGVEKLRECAAFLCGKHDFKAFCAANSAVKTTVRTVYEVRVEERRFTAAETTGREIDFFVTGNGFLYNMVRTMTGEILALANGKRSRESLLSAFETGRRELLDKTMPAKGLTLTRVDYGFDLFGGGSDG